MLCQKLGASYECHDMPPSGYSSSSSSSPNESIRQRKELKQTQHLPRRTQSVRVNPIVRVQNEGGQESLSQSLPKDGDGSSQFSR